MLTAVAQVDAVAQIQSLAWELSHAAGTAKKNKKTKQINKSGVGIMRGAIEK